MDSKLVVEQMSGRWKIKHPDMKPLAAEAGELAGALGGSRTTWIPREQNKHADRLANEAMDAGQGPAGRRSDRPARTALDVPARPAPRQPSLPAGTARQRDRGWLQPTRRADVHCCCCGTARPRSPSSAGSPAGGDPELSAIGLAPGGGGRRRRLRREPYHLDVIVSSPLGAPGRPPRRSPQRPACDVEVDEGLRETDFGDWEGYTFAEVRARWPGDLAAWLADPTVAPPGRRELRRGRPTGSQRRRTGCCERYAGRTVLVVSARDADQDAGAARAAGPAGGAVPDAPRPGLPVDGRLLRRRAGRGAVVQRHLRCTSADRPGALGVTDRGAYGSAVIAVRA